MYATIRPSLEVRHLRMLVAIAEAGSVSDAADALAVTPSALTHRIREAERRLGLALYSRVRGRLRPTPAGEGLRQAAERLLADLDRAEADARAVGGGVGHVVRLGIGFYTAYHWLPQFLHRLSGVAPDVQVEIVADAARRPLDMLLEGGIDVAIVSGDPTGTGVEGVRLFTDELVAIMTPGHALAGRAHIVAEDLVDEDYITYSRTAMPGHEYDRLMRPANVYPRRWASVELPEAIAELVSAGFGVSILAHWAVAPHIRWGRLAHARVTADGLPIEWYAALRAADDAAAPARAVARVLAEWCRDVPDAFAGA